MDLHLLYKIINAAIFVGLLIFFLRRPLKEFWRNRSEGLRQRIELARQHRASAEAKFNELATRMSRIQSEMQALRDRLEQDGRLESEKIVSSSKEYALRLEAGGRRVADQDMVKAQYRLRELGAEMSVNLAERLIRDEITPKDQQRLVRDFLAHLDEADFKTLGGGHA
jgi:F-type H+-transporting ATPase subunit b